MTRRYVLWDGDTLVGEYDYDGALLHRYAHWVGTDVPLLWYEGSTLEVNFSYRA